MHPSFTIYVWKSKGITPSRCVELFKKMLEDPSNDTLSVDPKSSVTFGYINESLQLGLTSKGSLAYINKLVLECDYRVSFAGRLDPMASGILPIVVAHKSIIASKCEELQSGMKTYEFKMYCGIQTDSYDILGMPFKFHGEVKTVDDILEIKEQKYPPYSSKTITDPKSGKKRKLFEFANEGRLYEISHLVPSHPVEIQWIEKVSEHKIKGIDVLENINKNIGLLEVTEGFRVEDIKRAWSNLIDPEGIYIERAYRCRVSSGVYVRGLANDMGGTAFDICRVEMGTIKTDSNRDDKFEILCINPT